MQPFMDLGSLTPQPGRLKSVWVRGADGQLECLWVPDWEHDLETAPASPAGVEPFPKAS